MATLIDRVSAFVGDVAMKSPVRVHANANIVLSNLQTIDGVTVVAGDRVSVGGQASGINNGIYDVSASAWTRSVDCDGAKDIVGGSLFYIVDGTAFAGVLAAFGGTGAKTPGTDALTITTSPTTITAASLAGTINAATNKATPVDADLFGIRDSVSGLLNRLTWANLKTALSLVTGNWAINAATATTATNQSGGTVNATTIAASSTILSSSPTGGIGYGTGSGGSVTQASTFSTDVTLNRINGRVVTAGGSINAGQRFTFRLNNTSIQPNDMVAVQGVPANTSLAGLLSISAESDTATQSVLITIANTSSLGYVGALTIKFAVLKVVIN